MIAKTKSAFAGLLPGFLVSFLPSLARRADFHIVVCIMLPCIVPQSGVARNWIHNVFRWRRFDIHKRELDLS